MPGKGLVIASSNWENRHTMKKFMLRRLGVAHEPGGLKPSLQDCIEAVLEQRVMRWWTMFWRG